MLLRNVLSQFYTVECFKKPFPFRIRDVFEVKGEFWIQEVITARLDTYLHLSSMS